MTNPRHRPESEPLLTPSEVATLFRVDPKTVTRWAKAGKLTSIRTLGGHRRYRESEVRSLLEGNTNNTVDALVRTASHGERRVAHLTRGVRHGVCTYCRKLTSRRVRPQVAQCTLCPDARWAGGERAASTTRGVR